MRAARGEAQPSDFCKMQGVTLPWLKTFHMSLGWSKAGSFAGWGWKKAIRKFLLLSHDLIIKKIMWLFHMAGEKIISASGDKQGLSNSNTEKCLTACVYICNAVMGCSCEMFSTWSSFCGSRFQQQDMFIIATVIFPLQKAWLSLTVIITYLNGNSFSRDECWPVFQIPFQHGLNLTAEYTPRATHRHPRSHWQSHRLVPWCSTNSKSKDETPTVGHTLERRQGTNRLQCLLLQMSRLRESCCLNQHLF